MTSDPPYGSRGPVPATAYLAESSASLQYVRAGYACVWAPCSPHDEFAAASIVPRFAAFCKVFPSRGLPTLVQHHTA